MRRLLVPALSAACLWACAPAEETPASIAVENAWVRAPAVTGRPAAGYMTITAGKAGDTLLAASSPAAERIEIHESMATDGMMTMTPLQSVPVAANESVSFAPGGKHLMLFGLDPKVAPGGTMAIDLKFAKAGKISVTAAVKGPADVPPGADHQH